MTERYLQINVGVLGAFATVMLAVSAEQSYGLALLAVCCAVIALVFSDWMGWCRLNRIVANIAALAAFVMTVREVMTGYTESQLMGIAKLLVYLQIILQFQRKDVRTYWQLIVLSLLQVVVAAALNLGFTFGFLLIIYLVIALSAMMLFLVYRECLPYATQRQRLDQRQRQERRIVNPLTNAADFERFREDGLSGRMISWALCRQLASMAWLTLIGSVILFFLIPRRGEAWNSGRSGQRSVGFTDVVELNDVGRVLENPQPVMKVRFRDVDAKPFKLADEPYFRGAVLSYYSRGRWRVTPNTRNNPQRQRQLQVCQTPFVRQEVELQSDQRSVLFAISPVYRIPDNRISRTRIIIDLLSGQLSYGNDQAPPPRPFSYELATTGIRHRLQNPVIPELIDPDAAGDGGVPHLIKAPERNYQRGRHDDPPLPLLKTLADEIVASSGVKPGDHVGTARALEAHFLKSGNYIYSLETPPRVDRRLDPIEDFVQNTREGHCEYFASALALMLRSQGIPSRVVVGFLGGDYNTVANYYQVRQLHTHLWVEAYLEPDQWSGAEYSGIEQTAFGGWLRLDPTPAGDDGVAAANRNRFADQIGLFLDYCEIFWSDYVVGLTYKTQNERIYTPVRESFAAISTNLRETFERFGFDRILRGEWFNWQAGLLTLVGGIVLIGIYQVTRFLARWLLPGWKGRRVKRRRRGGGEVDFFYRYEKLMEAGGWKRDHSVTPAEFVAETAPQIQSDEIDMRAILTRFADTFYRVRYGGQKLNQQELSELDRSLSQLEAVLAGNPN